MERIENLEAMNEEMETEQVETEVETTVIEPDVEPEKTDGSIVVKVIVGGLVLIGTAALLFHEKIENACENHSIKKLRKKGYVVIDPKNQPIEATVSDAEEATEESDECDEVED
jgi:hypothetical protein